ncbi:MAG: 2-dehydro-3-deoxyphosphooctonate aldolase [Candidatus Anoxychlamydiales bacterium]|nr:2-dehydro-3-deoxyphosphooctonate aldolase [Candidatus Anoxychlamydiales bacterium]NGX36571.1 2-dehydro-3-deoxyphosphooctonate aldolase [Candidatus Anoxychlamydiales bacterium]
MKKIKVKDFLISDKKLTFISGPCVIEDEEHTLFSAEKLKEIFSKFDFNFIFKASFDKANRSSINSFRGPGLDKGLKILEKVKEKLDLAITSDIHLPSQAKEVADVLDIIQIPAFLCRQTDLLVEAGKTQKPVNVKKGQFMSPFEMKNVLDKLLSTGNENIILTDRGTSFGYNNLVTDFRAIAIMKKWGYPICFDASHSTQLPGGSGTTSSGQKEFISPLAKASIIFGADVIFIESHPDPKKAKSDSATVMAFEDLEILLKEMQEIYKATREELVLC